ncbi:alternative ribosome rescue aminoacyl-tRNA hydrolase ArfB [Iamia majanohamensis]|uniref:Alternative ribosome rescue aminoacyl-tRNA hydrolase ArfB n=1 Tax=Iamia majanohamensis TaxID=467976 RepID=A0AAE9Y529_9ACTN|nr:alternative ribosome rescue aminoacyl-tRNA hydrolase ArfB [Iamia majanohamensis]WCO66495.1 alternative ribosome rescue aminoacyl-tRNA hydrolase ArfB [Iamia majanohamensis]
MASDDLPVSGRLTVPGWELVETFSTSGGPGGQHANKASTRVELRFDVDSSSVLSRAQKQRVRGRVGAVLRVVADDERSQARNREIARQRLAEGLREALVPPRRRVPTRPSRGSERRRLQAKRENSERKQQRRRPRLDE